MFDTCFIPEAHSILAAGISIHGTGFDREALVPSILVIGFFIWTMRGAPVNERASGGFTLGWVILLAFLIFGLLAPGESFGAAGFPDYAPQGEEFHVNLRRPAPWNGIPITPIVIALALWFLIPEGKGKAQKPKQKPQASKPDPVAQIVMDSLRSGKKLIPLALLVAFPATADAAGPVVTADSASWWVAPTYLLIGIGAALTVPVAIQRGRLFIAVGLALICVHSGVTAYRLSVPEAAAGMVGNLFESDGEKAVKQAEAERIRLEADARYRREIALLQSRGHVTAPATEPNRSMVPITIVFLVAVTATILYWREIRTREAREDELRRLQIRLAVAESRTGWTREPGFGEPSAFLLEDRHGR